MLEHALKYLSSGWSVVPAHKDSKHPIVNWTEFQKRRATEAELKEWFKDDQYNIGIVTGRISNLVVIDIDKGTDIEKLISYYPLPETATVETGGEGRHYFYQYPKDRIIFTQAGKLINGFPNLWSHKNYHRSGWNFFRGESPKFRLKPRCGKGRLKDLTTEPGTLI